MFMLHERVFYRQLETKPNEEHNGLPSEDDIINFWSEICANQEAHKENAEWINEEEVQIQNIAPM